MRWAAYIRVSTVDQNTYAQQREVSSWLGGNGYSAIQWFEDKASGNDLSRPDFKRLQQEIFHGRVDGVVVWKLDRLTRDLCDGINVLADWCEKGMRVVSVTQQIDLTGGVGRMIAAVLLGVAEMERESIREYSTSASGRTQPSDSRRSRPRWRSSIALG